MSEYGLIIEVVLVLGWPSNDFTLNPYTYLHFRAVQLGLTAEDMLAVQEYTDTLREKRKPESVATIIKREVAMEESQMRVSLLLGTI